MSPERSVTAAAVAVATSDLGRYSRPSPEGAPRHARPCVDLSAAVIHACERSPVACAWTKRDRFSCVGERGTVGLEGDCAMGAPMWGGSLVSAG